MPFFYFDSDGLANKMAKNKSQKTKKTSHSTAQTITIGLIAIVAASILVSLTPFNCQSLTRSKEGLVPDSLNARWDRLRLCQIVPEYERSLKKIVVSLGTFNHTLKLQHNILSRLPEYTEIILLLPECNLKQIKNELKNKPYRNRIKFVAFQEHKYKDNRFFLVFPDKDKLVQVDTSDSPTAKQQGTAWAQDLFEVMKKSDGSNLLLTPELHKYYYSVGNKTNMKAMPDNMYLNNLAAIGVETVRTPLVFQGGNIFVDEINGQRIVFCGGDILNETRMVWQGIAEKHLSDSQIITIITKIFNADKVIVFSINTGKRLQPALMYHLDQAMIPLGNGAIGIARVTGEHSLNPEKTEQVKDVKRFLSKLRSALPALGYKLIDIDVTVDNLLRCQHYINAIPYIDAKTGQKTLFMPIFPEQSDFDKEVVRKNTAAFETLGYSVITVPTEAGRIKGGIHCLVNVLE